MLCTVSAFAFDWAARPNKELHEDLVTYAEQVAKECQDSTLATALNEFVDKEK